MRIRFFFWRRFPVISDYHNQPPPQSSRSRSPKHNVQTQVGNIYTNCRSELIIKSVVRAAGFREFECRSNRRHTQYNMQYSIDTDGSHFLFDGRVTEYNITEIREMLSTVAPQPAPSMKLAENLRPSAAVALANYSYYSFGGRRKRNHSHLSGFDGVTSFTLSTADRRTFTRDSPWPPPPSADHYFCRVNRDYILTLRFWRTGPIEPVCRVLVTGLGPASYEQITLHSWNGCRKGSGAHHGIKYDPVESSGKSMLS